MVQKSTKPATLGELKAALMQQILNNSNDFVEAWKQDYRNKKALALAARREVLNEVISFEKKASKIDLSGQTSEQIKQAALTELKEKSKTSVTEEWKIKAANQKVAILNNRHSVLVEIAEKKSTKNARKELAPVTVQSKDQKADLLSAIRQLGQNTEVIPEWKETQMNQKRNTIENKRKMIFEFDESKSNNFEAVLENTNDLSAKRAKVMEGIRLSQNTIASAVVEAWKQENRDRIAQPMINKQQMMSDLVTRNHAELKCIKDPREQLLEALRTANDTNAPVEAWKIANNKAKSEAIKNKRAVVCDISEKKGLNVIKKEANRTDMLAEIRETVNQKAPATAPVVENWRQQERNCKSDLIVAKKLVLVDVEATKSLRPVGKTEQERHSELMTAIRTDQIPAWKEAVNSARVGAIQAKKSVNADIEQGLVAQLKNKNSVQENKVNLMKDIRAKAGNFTEAWKEGANNDRATAIGSKGLVQEELKNHKPLAATRNQAQLKTDSLKELRLRADTALPQWKEEILDSQAQIKGNRHSMICDIANASKAPLAATKSLEEVKAAVLAEVRRPQPVEAWKEEQRGKIAMLYNNKREVASEIANKKFELNCARSQSELRKNMLKEVRAVSGEAVPAWKESKLEKRADVHSNKKELNRCIESLKL